MVVFIRLSKAKKYILIGIIIIIFGFAISYWNNNIKTTNVFGSKSENLMLELEIQEIFDIRNNAILEEDIEILNSIYNKETRNGLLAYEHEGDLVKLLHGIIQVEKEVEPG